LLNKANFTIDHIRDLQRRTRRDPTLLERTLFAFGVLEALVRVDMPLIFKGGTSLMLLLGRPKRISTDIDIAVTPDASVDGYIEKASTIFPFTFSEEQYRAGKNGIIKRHFKFYYDSPVLGKENYILLDVLYENCVYDAIITRPIAGELLLTDDPLTDVAMPALECMVGDKLTAFAPHTAGIPFGEDKELEIVKQFFDVASLFSSIEDLVTVASAYKQAFAAESGYRGLDSDWRDGLADTIRACICIMGKGTYDSEEFPLLMRGINAIKGHIFDGKYSGEVAASQACMVMYLAASLLANGQRIEPIASFNEYRSMSVPDERYAKLSYIRKLDLQAYAYLVEAIKLLG
jgi:hypothetical protein